MSSEVQRYITGIMTPVEMANPGPASISARQTVVVTYEDYAALEAECERLRDKYQRDVYGLNNEGDPIGGEPAGGYANDNARLRAELSALKAQQVGQESEPAPKQHPDDAAVDRFAAAMKAKLARSREKGRHGWQNCTAPHLSAMLYDHLYKADPLDVGNFAMMLHQNGQAIELPFEARGRHTTPQPAPAQDVAGMKAVMTGLIDLAHEYRHTLARQHFPDNDEGDAFARHRDSQVARIDRILGAAHDKQSGGAE